MMYLAIALGIVAALVVATGAVYLIENLRPPADPRGLADRGEFVSVEGLSVHVRREGKAHPGRTPVVLVHGFGANNWCWRFTIAELARRRAVYAPDLPGFGLSDKPEGFDYTLSGYARFIGSFMDEMGICRAILVGNSMGGGVAVEAALLVPGRVEKLVLIDSLGYHKTGFHAYRLFGLPLVRDLIMAVASPFMLRLLLAARVYHDPARVDKELAHRFSLAYRTKNGRRAPLWVWRGLSPSPTIPRARIGAVGVPTLVIWGRHDKILPVRHARLFARDITGSRVEIIPDAGHVPHEERPDAVNRLIVDFIEGK
jgi:pimeloyl-ACP methyl ester carboxylesterase